MGLKVPHRLRQLPGTYLQHLHSPPRNCRVLRCLTHILNANIVIPVGGDNPAIPFTAKVKMRYACAE